MKIVIIRLVVSNMHKTCNAEIKGYVKVFSKATLGILRSENEIVISH